MSAEPANEIFEIIDETGKVIGTEKRGIVHQKGLLHRVSDVFVLNKENKIFIQQRSFDKLVYPEFWDISTAEHLQPGETYKEAAVRGVKEELGIESINMEKLGKRDHNLKGENFIDNEQVEVFKCRFNGEIKIDKEEIEQGKWISKQELLKEMNEKPEKFTPWFFYDRKFFGLL